MELNLRNESRIADVKQAFHQKFPFLKLEFFHSLADEVKRFHASNVITDEQKQLGEIAEMNKPGYVRIHEYRTVADVEHCFRECFGLFVQVFRKSGSNWIETSNTDARSLADQNKQGEERFIPFRPERLTADIHEQE